MPVVAAIIVTFHPDRAKLRRLLTSLLHQVSQVFVVDNGADSTVSDWIREWELSTTTSYLAMLDNLGVGAAQNRGAQEAVRRGATHVILFDQDSAPEPGMVSELLRVEARLLEAGVPVGALGPQLYDEETRQPFRFVQFRYGLKRLVSAQAIDSEWIETEHLVASGTMIRTSVLAAVGPMREDLFLEYVDVEWGVRALSRGFHLYAVKAASMLHNLGDRRARILFGLKVVPLHSPVRHYYTVRNAVVVLQLPHVPARWKVQIVLRTALEFAFFGFFCAPRRDQLRMMLRGVRDGWRRRLGPFSDSADSVTAWTMES